MAAGSQEVVVPAKPDDRTARLNNGETYSGQDDSSAATLCSCSALPCICIRTRIQQSAFPFAYASSSRQQRSLSTTHCSRWAGGRRCRGGLRRWCRRRRCRQRAGRAPPCPPSPLCAVSPPRSRRPASRSTWAAAATLRLRNVETSEGCTSCVNSDCRLRCSAHRLHEKRLH